jgi:hypothetical protein
MGVISNFPSVVKDTRLSLRSVVTLVSSVFTFFGERTSPVRVISTVLNFEV